MAFITWEEKYSVKIKSIDEQHKKLFALINELHDSMLHGKSKDVMGKVLAELVDYTVSHFAAEEGYMRNHSFLGFDSHKKEHDDLAKQAAAVLSDFKSGKTVLSMAVMDFLKDWLYKHILKTDMLYVNHLVAKGVN